MEIDKIKNINDLKRKVVEFLLRIERDSKKFKQNLFLIVDEGLVFGYNVEDDCWLMNGENWKPTVEEVIDTIDNYDYISLEAWKQSFIDYEDYVNSITEELVVD